MDDALKLLLNLDSNNPPTLTLRTIPRMAKKDQERFVELQIGHLVARVTIGDFSRLCSQTLVPNSVPVELRVVPVIEVVEDPTPAA